MTLREHFETQLAKHKVLTEDDIKGLKGSALYGPYQPGDIVLFFMEQEADNLTVVSCTERDLAKMETYYEFVRTNSTAPIFRKGATLFPVLKRRPIHQNRTMLKMG